MSDRAHLAAAWDEGAKWAAVECGAIPDESAPWLVASDNPYRDVEPVLWEGDQA